MGLRVLGPDVNRSERAYTGRGRTVRLGLMQLKGLPAASLEALLAERRRGGPYPSFDEFLARVGERVGPEAIRILVRAGAFDAVASGTTRPRLLWQLTAWNRRREHAATPSLFPDTGPDSPLPRPPAYDEHTTLAQEAEILGFLASRHPLSLFRREIRAIRPVPARDLARHVGRTVSTVGWYVTGKTVETRRGEPMEFLSFEDTTALYDTTFFPAAYRRFASMMRADRPYRLRGRVEEDQGTVHLNVAHAAYLDDLPAARRARAAPA
jgi:error-prone DNA polymerase